MEKGGTYASVFRSCRSYQDPGKRIGLFLRGIPLFAVVAVLSAGKRVRMINPERKLKMKAKCHDLMDTPRQIIADDNRYRMTIYSVFPGIEFSFVDVHGYPSINAKKSKGDRMLEITYCREGRSEFHLNDEFVFLSPGDLMIVKANTVSPVMNFPLKHYHGLTIRMDLDKTPHCLSCILADVEVQPKSLAEKFCGDRIGYIARANPAIAHIFSEIYSVSEHIRKGYCKIKTLELLLFLSQLSIEGDVLQKRLHSRTQVLLAETIAKYLSEHMDDRITLEQLSEVFHVSVVHIKNTFKRVYDVPVGAYVRTLKMESAAVQLEHTDKTILEIAAAHGYDNGSKFAAAFRAVKGMNPAQYRSEMRRTQKSIRLEPLSVGSERKEASFSGIICS